MPYQHKSVEVIIPTDWDDATQEIIRRAIAEHETDGWKGQDSDATNEQRIVRYGYHTYTAAMNFVRERR